MTTENITLGEVLSREASPKQGNKFRVWLWKSILRVLNLGLLAAIFALLALWFSGQKGLSIHSFLTLLAVLIILWLVIFRNLRETRQHFLLANDRQGFLHELRQDKKTVVFDGCNIYHLGHDKGLDAQPLGEIAYLLRSQGYRIVCFFDANIFYTLSQHGAFSRSQKHSIELLKDIFGLRDNEIYIVPSRVQADRYILEFLKHMPVSFAVTNDKFRDYENQYPTVMKDNLWRKGVVISGDEVILLQHQI